MHTYPVRVSISASVAADLGHFKKAVGSILDKLGCPACCSGHDIHFELLRNLTFVERIEEDFQVRTFANAKVAQDAPAMVASLAPDTAQEIDHVFEAIDRIADLAGCPACCSGHDLLFGLERQFVMDERLNIKEQVLTIG